MSLLKRLDRERHLAGVAPEEREALERGWAESDRAFAALRALDRELDRDAVRAEVEREHELQARRAGPAVPLEQALGHVIRRAVAEAVADGAARAPSPGAVEGAEYLSIPAAARRLGVSVSSIRKWLAAGRLTAYGQGRVVRLRASELDALMRATAPDVDRAATDALARMRRGRAK